MRSRRYLLLALLLATSCSPEPQTALRLTVHFDAALQLDQLLIGLSPAPGERPVPDPPAALTPGWRLVLLVPDDWADTTIDVTLVGLAATTEVARGQVSGTPRRSEVVDLDVTLTATTCPSTAPACEKQQGVCKGSVKKCSAAGWLTCADADYQSFAGSKGLVYEKVESTCDGQDNDCDGQIDDPSSCCQPQCAGKACGADDGCQHPCQTGSCGTAQVCDRGQCGAAPMSCLQVIGCANACLVTCTNLPCRANCGSTCKTKGCASAAAPFDALYGCIVGQCLIDCIAGATTACSTCLQQHCPTEETACAAHSC